MTTPQPMLNRTPTKTETPFAAVSVWVDAESDSWCRVKRSPKEPFTVDLFRGAEHVFSRACSSLEAAMTTAEGLRRIHAAPAVGSTLRPCVAVSVEPHTRLAARVA